MYHCSQTTLQPDDDAKLERQVQEVQDGRVEGTQPPRLHFETTDSDRPREHQMYVLRVPIS